MSEQILIKIPPIPSSVFETTPEKTLTYNEIPFSQNINKKNIINIKNSLKLSNETNNTIKNNFQIFQLDGQQTIIKEHLFNGEIIIKDSKIPICKKSTKNSTKCEKLDSGSILKKSKINTLISRKLKRFMNIPTLFNMVNQIPKFNSPNCPERTITPAQVNTRSALNESKRCLGALPSISEKISKGNSSISEFKNCFAILLRILFFSYRGTKQMLTNFIKHNNENLFFEIGTIVDNLIISPEPNYKYFMYTQFVETYPRTKIQIPFIIKISDEFLKKMLSSISYTLRCQSNFKNIPNNVINATNNFIKLLENPESINVEKIISALYDPKYGFFEGSTPESLQYVSSAF